MEGRRAFGEWIHFEPCWERLLIKAPIAWLREYVALPANSQAVADTLANIGFPVDGIERRPKLSGIVAGKVAALDKHPNADRLQIAVIDTGGSAPVRIATAATNVVVGGIVAVATIGAQLPRLIIERRSMRGFESEGMMCSADELGLPAEWFEEGILQLDVGTPVGADVVQLFNLQDDVFDVDITANRADAMSMVGLARELAAATNEDLRVPAELHMETEGLFASNGASPGSAHEEPRVTIETADCFRFVVQRFDNVTVGNSPLWMRVRLALAGQRPINSVVDISNYVMLELGQPTHCYDGTKIRDRHFIVRDARQGERLRTLDDVEFSLTPGALVIADEDAARGLAGLKGGRDSEVTRSTRCVFLESATFSGVRVRRMSASLGLRTDASARHERNLPPLLADFGAARVAALLAAAGATARAPQRFGNPLPQVATIDFWVPEVQRLLGFTLGASQVARHLRSLGCQVTATSATLLRVQVPWWRTDIAIGADIVEEVGRMAGYDRVETVMPAVRHHSVPSRDYAVERNAADALAALGYREVMTYALQSQEPARRLTRAGLALEQPPAQVRNPLSEDQRYLRFDLASGLLATFARYERENFAKIFEIGHIFALENDVPRESSAIGFALRGVHPAVTWHDDNFLRLKGDAELLLHLLAGCRAESTRIERSGLHPGKSSALLYRGKPCAFFGELDPRLVHAYGLRNAVYYGVVYLQDVPLFRPPRYKPISRFPASVRDIALVLPSERPAQDVEETIVAALGTLAKSVQVFDEYRGAQIAEGMKSIGVRVTMQRDDATMTDAQADAVIARALASLRRELGAVMRE